MFLSRPMRWAVLLAALQLAACLPLVAEGAFEVLSGKAFDAAFVKDFYLEGNSIPTEKRNAALIKTSAGARAEFALLDTSGYSSQVQEKYAGMIISEGDLSVCGVKLGVGSFGFGTKMPKPPSTGSATVFFYDQAGKKLGECTADRDSQLKAPRPLQVVVSGGKARLYLGVYGLELSE
jgi:hypothetical protein